MADRYIPEHRKTTFKAKNTFKPDELRRRREEQQVEIRKQKREENLAKRRGITSRGEGALGASLGAAPDSDDESGTIESQVCALSKSMLSLRTILYHLGSSVAVRYDSQCLVHELLSHRQKFACPVDIFIHGSSNC